MATFFFQKKKLKIPPLMFPQLMVLLRKKDENLYYHHFSNLKPLWASNCVSAMKHSHRKIGKRNIFKYGNDTFQHFSFKGAVKYNMYTILNGI